MKQNWMVIAGVLIISASLVNSLSGIHQTFSPFDMVGGEPQGGSENDFKLTADAINYVEAAPEVQTIGGFESGSANKTEQIYEDSVQSESLIPDRLVITSIELDAPVMPTKIKKIDYQGQTYYQWLAPNKPAVGWHDSSAYLGQPGNTVLNGHHNVYGEIFKDLVKLHEGDLIEVYSGNHVFRYRVALSLLLPERFKSLSVRLENARWLLPTEDERITLITCWPADSNTHRVVIVALPEE